MHFRNIAIRRGVGHPYNSGRGTMRTSGSPLPPRYSGLCPTFRLTTAVTSQPCSAKSLVRFTTCAVSPPAWAYGECIKKEARMAILRGLTECADAFPRGAQTCLRPLANIMIEGKLFLMCPSLLATETAIAGGNKCRAVRNINGPYSSAPNTGSQSHESRRLARV